MNDIKRTKFNINFLGDTAVGKTSIIKCYKGEEFDEGAIATIGIDYIMDKREIDGKTYTFKIYDTAGQERYKSICVSYLKIADGFLLVFSVDDKKTFKRIVKWMNEIIESINPKEKIIYLVGNKIDKNPREVSNEEAMNFAKENNIRYFETSAKTGFGVQELFKNLYQEIYDLNEKQVIKNKKQNKKENIKLDERNAWDKQDNCGNFC